MHSTPMTASCQREALLWARENDQISQKHLLAALVQQRTNTNQFLNKKIEENLLASAETNLPTVLI